MSELPADPMAEAQLILAVIRQPEILLDAGDLIVSSWQHVDAWRATVRTQRDKHADIGSFFLAWSRELCRICCSDKAVQERKTIDGEAWHIAWHENRCVAFDVWAGMERLVADMPYRIEPLAEGARWLCTYHAEHDLSEHTFDYWHQRLLKVKEQRDMVDLAHRIAMRAWHGDSEGAVELARTLVPYTEIIADMRQQSLSEILGDA